MPRLPALQFSQHKILEILFCSVHPDKKSLFIIVLTRIPPLTPPCPCVKTTVKTSVMISDDSSVITHSHFIQASEKELSKLAKIMALQRKYYTSFQLDNPSQITAGCLKSFQMNGNIFFFSLHSAEVSF